MDINCLDRFIQAQEIAYPIALQEIKNGKKTSHWMWYMFPQLRGLGRSSMAHTYGIEGLNEAKAYLAHPVLSGRLYELCETLLLHRDKRVEAIFGDVDSMKLRSSMTLFALVSIEGSLFYQVLDCFFEGKPDKETLRLAGQIYC